jgi:hypothetical protein
MSGSGLGYRPTAPKHVDASGTGNRRAGVVVKYEPVHRFPADHLMIGIEHRLLGPDESQARRWKDAGIQGD